MRTCVPARRRRASARRPARRRRPRGARARRGVRGGGLRGGRARGGVRDGGGGGRRVAAWAGAAWDKAARPAVPFFIWGPLFAEGLDPEPSAKIFFIFFI